VTSPNHSQDYKAGLQRMFSSLRHELDPLDCEILDRAFHAALAETECKRFLVQTYDRENLETVLRTKLIEIIRTNDFSDAEALRDALLERLRAAKS
jgi:hypothetical protein